MNKLKEIYRIFFPNTISDKYRHIGYSYLNVPYGWKSIVEKAIIDIEKEMWPQKYLPLFIKRLIHYLATGNTVYWVKYQYFHDLRKKLTGNQLITDIKDKFAGLRIYGYHNDKIQSIIDNAEKECENTCEHCGSTEDTQIVGNRWIENLCINCRTNGKKNSI
jgi:hypothetical protein